MSVDANEVRKIAHLGRLELNDAEIEALGRDLNNILGYVSKLSELDTEGIATLEHAADFGETLRADENRPSLPREESLENAPKSENGCFAVPKIIEGGE